MFVSDWLFSPVKISLVDLETICCDSNGIPTSSYGQFVYMCFVVAKNLKALYLRTLLSDIERKRG